MQATDAIRTSLENTQKMLAWYLGDLSDADLVVRPTAGANHIAWQLGHLIVAERNLMSSELPDAAYPELPAGFAEKHGKETASQEPPSGFATKAQYLDLFNRTRQATLNVLARLSDKDLDRPSKGRMAEFAPTLGTVFLLQCDHTMMHAGQFTVTRRKLGKPVLF
jgi:hypothetical protein